MIRLNYKKHLSYSVSVAILAIVLMAMPDQRVKSQTAADGMPPPNKLDHLGPPMRDIPPRIMAPTAIGELIERSTIDFSSSELASAVAIQADGKIVSVGSTIIHGNPGRNCDFAVSRYNPDGSLDTSFDSDGTVTTPISNEYGNCDAAFAVAIQTDGKIIAAGQAGYWSFIHLAIVRYNTDGSLDTSFGTGGKVTAPGYGSISEISIQTDGKIVAATNGFSILRYNPSGTLDTSFGTGGVVTTVFDLGSPTASSVALQADAKIVAAGSSGYCDKENCYYDFVLARYNTDGSLDTSFDLDGKVTTPFNGQSEGANAVAIQPDGKIVSAGWSYTPGYFFVAARYNADGSLDASFDGDGKVILDLDGDNLTSSLALQSDGKIVASGGTAGFEDLALLRLNADGSLDSSFDGDGRLTTDFGAEDYGANIAIQVDGRIVAAGSSGRYVGNPARSAYDFAISRYNVDGSLDTSFDSDGKVKTTFFQIPSAITAIAGTGTLVGYCTIDGSDDFAFSGLGGGEAIFPIGNSDDRGYAGVGSGGSYFSAGYSDNGVNNDFALVRGTGGNPGFGQNGRVTTDFGGNNDEARAVVIQADHKIVVAGQTVINGTTALAMARYTVNGSIDASFGTDGKVTIPALHGARAMALQPDGKIIVAGRVGVDMAIARLNPNGALDTTFDTDGVAVTPLGALFPSSFNAVALQPYGKIVAAGFSSDLGNLYDSFVVARYNADGSLDRSFDTDGLVFTSFGSSATAHAVRVQRNGKILAVGAAWGTDYDFALARYNYDGSLDTTFDTDGIQTTDFFGSLDSANALAIENDGTIVVGGSAWKDGKTDFATARYVGDAVPGAAKFDFDGDGLSDVSTFRPSSGFWYVERSTLGFLGQQFGVSEDKLAPADYDGDGKTDIAVFRDGTWYIQSSTFVLPENPVYFGLPGDIPVPADYSGDGRAELTIYRDGYWWSLRFRSEESSVVQFGLPNDKPVPADYDGDGRVDQAVYRNGVWHLNRSTEGYTAVNFGLPTDRLVPADYDGDGKADLAVYRDGIWYLLQSTDGFAAFQFGSSTDIPVPADYDGDGRTDVAVFRDGVWYLLQSTSGFAAQQFGLQNDKPVPSAYVSN